jgi:outer membrane lipoprotein LolB
MLGRRSAFRLSCSTVVLSFLIAGCATNKSDTGHFYSKNETWSGRISLKTLSTPPQQLFTTFVLQGSPESGRLTLNSPIGTTLAEVSWSRDQAVLRQGGEVRQYPDLDTLTTALTGSELPVAAMFSWLNGQPLSAGGWIAQLADLPRGRLQARRDTPDPAAEIRIILDEPSD